VAAERLGKDIKDTKIITAHIGNGVSITAIDGGVSVDTSMGFSPLAGVMMGTRSGDVDPSLIPYLMDQLGLTDANDMIDILNRKSGLAGVSGLTSDFRDIIQGIEEGNERAKIAFDLYVDRIRKYIAQYFAVLNGADALVFTAGVGENAVVLRKAVAEGLKVFGIELDESLNVFGVDGIISSENSKVKVMVIPTDEELVIARDVWRIKNSISSKEELEKTKNIILS